MFIARMKLIAVVVFGLTVLPTGAGFLARGLTAQAPVAAGEREKLIKLEGPVTSAVWSPDGKLVAVVATRHEKAKDNGDNRPFDYFTTVRIRDAKTGAEEVSLGELKNAAQADRAFSA